MLAPVRFVSKAAHASDDRPPRFLRYAYDYDDGFVMVYSCDLPGPGVAGGLLRVGIGVDRVGRALRRARAVREGLKEDERMALSDKLIVGLDVVIGATNIVVGACDIVIGASGFVDYARAGMARIRGKASRGKSNLYLLEDGSADSSGVKRNETCSTIKPVLCHRRRIREIGKYDVFVEDLPEFNVSGQRKAETRYHRSLPKCRCLHLRCMRITGFKGIKGQAEFLVHTVENAPALEVLTIDTANRIGPPCKPADQFGVRIAKSGLEGRISPWTKLHILS
ncbi:hypothetical protein PR202_gb17577 [Eleusine coracana subsp. coracana]|uniref:FBD domain-containing protein n=1 Tax=Eleusine coracana subsp. coracana TaxID=191504 RepID=A0AAV5F540_ELECO|nr:hypothetical protein PR202_gb17577 [Eleusine coracana subsp. coracana]